MGTIQSTDKRKRLMTSQGKHVTVSMAYSTRAINQKPYIGLAVSESLVTTIPLLSITHSSISFIASASYIRNVLSLQLLSCILVFF